jgi:two-component system NarL family sensor kinase
MNEPESLAPAEALAKRNRELAILNAISEALNRSVVLDECLRTALARVIDLLRLETGWIWLLDEETGRSYLAAAQNLPPALRDDPGRMEGSCYCLDTFRRGDLAGAANINVVECSRLGGLVEGTGGFRYHSSIPLYAGEKKIGVMNVASSDWREIPEDTLKLLHTVSDLMGIAVERTRLYERSAQLGAVEERNRLAREIHDTLAQGLAAIAFQIESVEAMLEGGTVTEAARAALTRALDLTRGSIEEARRSVLDLRAAPLQGRTLAEALRELAREAGARGGFGVEFEAVGEGRPLPSRVESGLYRIAQEALENVVRHASAGTARLRLAAGPDEIRLSVEDDGTGFDPDRSGGPHFGLTGMNERARLLGGRFDLATGHGGGTRISVVVPLRDAP